MAGNVHQYSLLKIEEESNCFKRGKKKKKKPSSLFIKVHFIFVTGKVLTRGHRWRKRGKINVKVQTPREQLRSHRKENWGFRGVV